MVSPEVLVEDNLTASVDRALLRGNAYDWELPTLFAYRW
jgi:hypothetical protein